MSQAERERDYIEILTRVTSEWGEWEECSQVRRPSSRRFEFR